MLMDLLNGPKASASRVALIMGSPYASDLLYHKDLKALTTKHSNFTYLTAISRERMPDAPGPLYVQDRLATHQELLGSLLSSPRGLIYVCGIAGMELGILQKLAAVLAPEWLEQYLQVDESLRSDVKAWTRKMIHKEVRPTRRVFLEVY
jgi:sulfite reductase alpha subunit-like flavoprotein